MKKSLLFLALAGAYTAQGAVFYPGPEDMVGDVSGISDNGLWAVMPDDDNNISYLWNREDPSNPVKYENILLRDVADNGMCVGEEYVAKDGRYYPGVLKDGVWERLPVSSYALNMNGAVSVTPDGLAIGGYLYCSTMPSGAHGYIPCRWDWDEAEEDFGLTMYSEFDYGDHQGMYITSISPDGRVLAGSLFYGFAAQLDAAIIDGQLKCWEETEEKEVPWYWNGKYMGDETGYFINGFRDQDTNKTFENILFSIDNKGNIYGNRTKVLDVDADGNGNIADQAAVYNYLTEEWAYNETYNAWSCGLDQEFFFPFGDIVIVEGQQKNVVEEFNINTGGLTFSHVSSLSMDGQLLGGATRVFNPAIGGFDYTPCLILLDEPLINDNSSVDNLGLVAGKMTIVNGVVDFSGKRGTVFDLNGRKVGEGKRFNLAPGAYVAVCGRDVRKVVVR